MPVPAKIVVKEPTLLTGGAVLVSSLYGLVLLVPALASILVVSVLQFGPITFLLPLGVIAVASFFLPLGFGNPYVVCLARRLPRPSDAAQEVYIVQLTRLPRYRSGLLAVLEDADDIGLLQFTDGSLVFSGDATELTVPYGQIRDLRRRNAGWRSLFVYGGKTGFSVAGWPREGEFLFVERSSWLLPASRKVARRMYERLAREVQAAAPKADSTGRPAV
jgi:hypothetical protein